MRVPHPARPTPKPSTKSPLSERARAVVRLGPRLTAAIATPAPPSLTFGLLVRTGGQESRR